MTLSSEIPTNVDSDFPFDYDDYDILDYYDDYDDYYPDDDLEYVEPEWTDEDEAGLEEYEEDRLRKIAERNEY